MSPRKTGYSIIKSVYTLTYRSFKADRIILAPFAVFAGLEALSLIFLYLIPRPPLRHIFGPMIRTFWSDFYLHYPNNFLLLPKLAYFARMGLAIAIGSLLGAVAVSLVAHVYNKQHSTLKKSFIAVLKNYPSFFIIAVISILGYYLTVKLTSHLLLSYFLAGHTKLLFVPARFWLGPVLFFINLALAIIIQSFFVYAVPMIVIDHDKLIKAMVKSFVLFYKKFIPTVILVGLPILISIPISILNSHDVFLIRKFFPELVLYIGFAGIAVNSLIIDPLITVSTTIFYLETKKK